MKHIIILIATVFLHANVYSNSSSPYDNNNNEELIKTLSNSEDILKLSKLYYAANMLNLKAGYAAKEEGVEMTEDDIKNSEKITNLSKETFKKVINTHPEFEKMDVEERKEVLESAMNISLRRSGVLTKILECFGPAGVAWSSCANWNAFNRGVFLTCLTVSGLADIQLIISTDGAFAWVIQPVADAETEFCAGIAFSAATARCVFSLFGTIAGCIIAAIT